MKGISSSLSVTVFLFASLGQCYDYVIIGGGTGGLTVASRLSEDPDVTVAVLEAGDNAENVPEVFIPGMAGLAPARLNWQYATAPQTHLSGRTLTVNAGKALGGSTIINSMIFPRGMKDQYDAWGMLNNNDSAWTWDGLLPFFKKSEIFTAPSAQQIQDGSIRFDKNFHGSSGRVKVGYPNFYFPQSKLWQLASNSASIGFPLSPDLSNGDPHAVGTAPNSLDAANNTRCSAACAYILPFSKRPNLTVLLNATASHIVWAATKSEGKIVASAVEYVQNGKTSTIPVGREVVVSSGTIGTPKVLEMSGIGNSTILTAAGVKTVLSLPTVGENLADHVHSWANAFTNATLTKDALNLNATFAAEQRALWFSNRTGFYSAAPRSLGIAAPSNVFNSSQLQALVSQARLQLNPLATEYSNGNTNLTKGIMAQHQIALNLYEQNKNLPLEMNLEPGYSGPTPLASRPSRAFSTINSVLYAPLARGRTHISSSNPSVPPTVDPNYWGHPIDIAAQVGGIKLARRMLTTAPLSSIFVSEFEPGTQFQTDDQIEGWLRGVVASDNHETGTAAMMPQELGGVVDTKLVVYGTANVRVADASIVPSPISAHMSSTVYAIGEKAADLIKNSS